LLIVGSARARERWRKNESSRPVGAAPSLFGRGGPRAGSPPVAVDLVGDGLHGGQVVGIEGDVAAAGGGGPATELPAALGPLQPGPARPAGRPPPRAPARVHPP